MQALLTRLGDLANRVWPPDTENPIGRAPDWRLFSGTLAAGLILGALLLRWIPLQGYDWLTMFHRNQATDMYYPPWTSMVLRPLAELPFAWGLGLINGITLAAVASLTWRAGRGQPRGRRLLACGQALASLQVAVVLWTGHIDGLAPLGLVALPWAVPLVLMKATFIGFAVLTRQDWLLAALAFGLLSLLLWPGWVGELLATLDFRNTHPAAGGWRATGWLPPLLGLLMLLNSRRTDPFQAMAAGAFIYPFLLPYHHIVLLPALAALSPGRMLLAWLAAWAMAVPAGIEAHYWVYFVFPFAIWWWRRASRDDTWWALISGR